MLLQGKLQTIDGIKMKFDEFLFEMFSQKMCVFLHLLFFPPAGSSYHPPQSGPAGGCVPAIHPAPALRQRRLLH